MQRISWLVPLALLLLAPSARTASPTPPDGPNVRGLMALLKEHMAGKKVIGVGVGDIEDGVSFDAAAYASETKHVGRLQRIAEAVSGDTQTYIPFLVRNAWVIAPETRAEARTDLSGVSDIEATGSGLLLDRIVLSLAPDLLAEAGSEAGIAAMRLSPEARTMLARVLKPPIPITQSRDAMVTFPDGRVREGFRYDRLGAITEPLDLSKLHLRTRLWIEAAEVEVESQYQPLGRKRRHERPGVALGSWRDVEAPVETAAPNRFKPSDLDGKALTQPFGAEGVMTVAEALRRAEAATGLKLYPGAYADAPIFVGSPELACGEVLDGLRLALTGAWRKVGSGYVLCWDRRGVAAMNQTLAETTKDLVERVTRTANSVRDDPRWLDIAAKMPFAPDDPLALTAEQRERYYRRPGGGGPEVAAREARLGIPFAEMTPQQQAYLEECAKTDQMRVYPPGAWDEPLPHPRSDPDYRPFTPDDVRASRLGGAYAPEVTFELLLPGQGWVRNISGARGRVSPYNIIRIQDRTLEEEAEAAPDLAARVAAAEEWARKEMRDFKPAPFTLPAWERGVMVGPIGTAELEDVARRMKAARFTTLYYPALCDGYATYPGKAFPAHPALKGENGLAAAVAAGEANGLKVVATVSALAWRSPRQAVHWLDKHPDCLERDPLGRTRLQWLTDSARRKAPLSPGLLETGMLEIVRRDFVRATEPEVSRRLGALVDELARTKASGIMLTDWRPWTTDVNGQTVAPPLGFALADRLAELKRSGYDLLDANPAVIGASSVFVTMPDVRLLGLNGFLNVFMDPYGFHGLPNARDPHASLADGLLERAKSLRKDWTTIVLDTQIGAEPDAWRPDGQTISTGPKADHAFTEFGHGGAKDGWVVLDIPWNNADYAGFVPEEMRAHPSLLWQNWSEDGRYGGAKAIVLDFRFAPENVGKVLKYVR